MCLPLLAWARQLMALLPLALQLMEPLLPWALQLPELPSRLGEVAGEAGGCACAGGAAQLPSGNGGMPPRLHWLLRCRSSTALGGLARPTT